MSTATQPDEAVNADSFLDIVASVVSIMLIMVMMVGMRIRSTSVDGLVDEAVADSRGALAKELATEQSVRGDVDAAAQQLADLRGEIELKAAQRSVIGVTVAALEHDLRTRRDKLSPQQQGEFDLTQKVAQAHRELDELAREKLRAEQSSPAPVTLRACPTPISQTVNGTEVMFQLRSGRVAYVPVDRLLREAKLDFQRQAYKLQTVPELTGTVGPSGGFSLQYKLVRKDQSFDMAMASHRGAYPETKSITFTPIADDLGETADEALGADSQFRRALASYTPGRDTVTIWIYPDSFAAFRRLRAELYRIHYTVAARPLPAEASITFSPEGSKSAAQ